MLAIEVEYLTGRVVASDRESRKDAEWPPHPQRLFSALVAAYHECDLGKDERAALEWLERLSPPALAVSDASRRDSRVTYVPVNDDRNQFVENKKKGTIKFHPAIDPGIAIGRNRQERFFPTVIPYDPIVHFLWSDADEESISEHRVALERLVAEVPYLGHSTSLVRVSLTDSPHEVTLRPVASDIETAKDSDVHLRGVGKGRLAILERVYHQSIQTSRRQEAPDVPRQRYRWQEVDDQTSPTRTVFGDATEWFVFERVFGRALPLQSCLALTTSVRKAVCSACDDPLPDVLSGHFADGGPLDRPHVAFVPLAHVGHGHADGEIRGFAIILPRDISANDRRRIALALGRIRKVWMNGPPSPAGSDASPQLAFDWRVAPVTGTHRLQTLQPSRYVRASRIWATATPMVFGHFPRKLDDARTRRIVAECCEAIGLPLPCHITVSPTAFVNGVPLSHAFPSLSVNGKPAWTGYRKGKSVLPRHLVDGSAVRMRYHVALEFDEFVRGPIILGAGRYYGMGLCVPLRDNEVGFR
jgi:CRISPR-associated protein Csb2